MASSQHQINLFVAVVDASLLKAAVSKAYTNHSRTQTQMAGGINNPLQTSSRRINLSDIRHAQCRVFRMHTLPGVRKKQLVLIPSSTQGQESKTCPLQCFMSPCCQRKDIWIS